MDREQLQRLGFQMFHGGAPLCVAVHLIADPTGERVHPVTGEAALPLCAVFLDTRVPFKLREDNIDDTIKLLRALADDLERGIEVPDTIPDSWLDDG